nr:MAG TPA: hypothetical protein [Ackermannviridae sp.]
MLVQVQPFALNIKKAESVGGFLTHKSFRLH